MAKVARTLVVEDSRSMRQLLSQLLAERDHQVQTAESAEEALALFDETPFDLLIIDWTLPGMNGVELTREIRSRAGGQAPFILMVTGRSGAADLAAVLDAGASDFVAKPLSARLLETRLAIAERSIRAEASHAFSSGVHDPVDVAPQEAVTAAIRLCSDELRRVQLEQTLGPVPDVRAPQRVIARVVLELLLHAVASLGDEATEHRLFVVTGTGSDGRAEISVGHDGPRIPADRAHTLFDPYFTSPESSEPSGLGLAISKSLVERIGGTLDAESSVVRGTHFHVRLPPVGTARSSRPPE